MMVNYALFTLHEQKAPLEEGEMVKACTENESLLIRSSSLLYYFYLYYHGGQDTFQSSG